MNRQAVTEQLRARFRHKALAPETLFLLSADDALEFLEEAYGVGLTVAGVEGFLITENGAYQPRQEFSNDLADVPNQADQFRAQTRQLIRHGADFGIRFQIVLEESAA